MSNIIGTVITVEKFLGKTEVELTTNTTPRRNVHNFPDPRKYVIPKYQREIRWKEKQIIYLINDIRSSGSKFLGNIILSEVDIPQTENPKYEIVDGQQRITIIMMILKYLKNKYPRHIQNFSRSEFVVDSFRGFKILYDNNFNFEGIREHDKEQIVNGDDYCQLSSYVNIWNIIDKQLEALNSTDARMLFDNILNSEVNIILDTSRNRNLSVSFFLDVNLKGLPLDEEDIFKAYLFKYDSDDELKHAWINLKKESFKFNKEINEKSYYPIMASIFHYLNYKISKNADYSDIEFDTGFELKNNIENNQLLGSHIKGEHIIQVIRDHVFFKEVLEELTEFLKNVHTVISKQTTSLEFKNLFSTNGRKRYLEDAELKIIQNFINKTMLGSLDVPKILVMKFFAEIIDGRNKSKNEYKKFYACYALGVLFAIFEGKKSSDRIIHILKSNTWYEEVVSELREYFNTELTEKKLYSSQMMATSEEDQKYKAKSIATIYNYFVNRRGLIELKGNISIILNYLNDNTIASHEHYLICNATRGQKCSVQIQGERFDYQYGKEKKLKNSLFNFIFIPEQLNEDLGDKYILEKKEHLADKLDRISCDYSKKYIELSNQKINPPEMSNITTGTEAKEKLDRYFEETFIEQYLDFIEAMILAIKRKLSF